MARHSDPKRSKVTVKGPARKAMPIGGGRAGAVGARGDGEATRTSPPYRSAMPGHYGRNLRVGWVVPSLTERERMWYTLRRSTDARELQGRAGGCGRGCHQRRVNHQPNLSIIPWF